ncbi:MAG: T9SS type A sorting domain-containing protein [Flavobacteriales bacterium]
MQGVIFGGCENNFHYIEGLGGPYFGEYFNCLNFSSASHYLMYYKKGNETWGTPLSFTTSQETIEQIQLTIFPNPASNEVNFISSHFGLNTLFQLYNSLGKLIEEKNITTSYFTYKNEKNLQGIYFYHITNANGKASGKIIFN